MEKTLIMIKPDAVKIAEEIFSELDKLGKRIKTVKIPEIDIGMIEKHYLEPIQRHGEHLRNKIRKFFKGQSVILALYEGKNIIKIFREKIGPTNPKKAKKHTIRGRYCYDDLDIATKQNRFVRNAVHASSSPSEFEHEFSVWKDYFS